MKAIKKISKAVTIAVLFALLVRILFGADGLYGLLSVMSLTFLFLSPTIVGALTIYFSPTDKVSNLAYRIFVPWLSIILFIVITILLNIEGWACWIMISPVFFIAASIGGIIGGWLKKRKNNKLNISVLVLLPFFIGPIESLIDTLPATYKAYTYIDIDAPAEKIWDNVTRVKEISKEEDKGYLNNFLGFPRPVKAELNYEGVGAYREAKFTGGLVFHETVTEYVDNKKMVFNIKAYPYEIPSATLDEHVVIGGDYFDVLTGTYEIEKLSNGKNRLHLYSYFKMSTHFNFYAGWWGKWIMKDIQNNILQIEKKRSENVSICL